jgi:hypothetical protein
MALEVRTVNGKRFTRAGIAFGRDPVIVPDSKLREKLGPPNYAKGDTIESVLSREEALICRPIQSKGDGSANGEKR